MKKLLSILSESTTAGSVATVASPLGKDSIFAAESPTKRSPADFNMWKNSKLAGKQKNSGAKLKEGRYKQRGQSDMDSERSSRLRADREPRGSEAIDARLRAKHEAEQEHLSKYEQEGKFWLKTKAEQEHIDGPFTGKDAARKAAADLLIQSPELKGNLVITAWGPDETPVKEAYNAPKDMSDYNDDDWAEWDAKVSNVGKKAKEQNAKKVQDRRTGEWYVPEKKFDELKNSPEFQAQMKRMATKEGVAEGEKSPMFKDAQKQDRIRSLKNLIDIAKKQGRQLRVQELELELKKLQGVAEGQEITEEMIADRLKDELALMKKGFKPESKDISKKPADKEVQPKTPTKKDASEKSGTETNDKKSEKKDSDENK